MRPIIQVPRYNSINFRPNIQPDDNRVHSRSMLQDLYYNRIHEWEDKYQWFLPVQFDDIQRLQFNISIANNVRIDIINCLGQVLGTTVPIVVYDLAGNNDSVTGAHLYNHYFQFKFSDFTGLADGYYYALLTAGDGTDPNTKKQLSEPFHVATTHFDTSLIRYRKDNNTNDPVVFEQNNCIFNLRLPAIVKRATMDFDLNSYKNQNNDTSTIYFRAGRAYEVQFPYVPDYIHDTLNFAVGCEYLTIDYKQYALDAGAKWDDGITDNAPLRSPSIILRESNPHSDTIDRTVGPLLLINLPRDYPYAVQALAMGISTPNINLLPFVPRVIRSDADKDAFVTYLQALRTALGLEGSFSSTTNPFSYSIYYNNDTNEIYGTASRTLATTRFSLGVVGAGLTTISFGSGLVTVDWGDGSLPLNYNAGVVPLNANHNYAPGAYTVDVFGNMQSVSTDIAAASNFSTISNRFPSTLKSLSLTGTSITSFDTAVIQDAANLNTLIMRSGLLSTITNYENYTFPLLKNISFASNKLNSSNLGKVIIATNKTAINFGVYSGRLEVNNQTPPVTSFVVDAVNAAANLRTNYYWTVNT